MIQSSTNKKESGGFIPGLVSLIVPMYCCAEYVEELLDSLTSQEYSNLEILCVIDGSPDDTLERVEQYSRRDSRIRVLSQAHAGAGTARNYGLSFAKGEYLMFPDADDQYTPRYVKTMVEALERTGADMGVCRYNIHDYQSGIHTKNVGSTYFFWPTQKVVLQIKLRSFIHTVNLGIWNKIYRHQWILDNYITFSRTNSMNDVVFGFLALRCSRSVVFIKESLLTYCRYRNVHSISVSRGNNPLDMVNVYRELYQELEKRNLAKQYRDAYFLIWQQNLQGYASLCEDDDFVISIARFLATEAPWKTTKDRDLLYLAGLAMAIPEKRRKIIHKMLKYKKVSSRARNSLEKKEERLGLQSCNYEKIIKLLEEKYGGHVKKNHSVVAVYWNKFRMIGPISSLALGYRKVQRFLQMVKA